MDNITSEKQREKDVKIIIQYKDQKDQKPENVKTFQEIMQKLFNSYIIKAMQNKKDK